MRLWDYSRRDPRSGAYQAGHRIDLTAFAATAKRAESALRKVARDRLVAEATRAQSADDSRPLSPPLIELAIERLESASRTGELAPSSVALYTVALGHVRNTSLASMAVADVRPADVAACLSEVRSLAGTSERSYRAGTGMAKTTRAVLNRTFRHAVEQGWIDSNPVRDGGSIRTPKRRNAAAGGPPASPLEHHRALTSDERIALAWAVARSERAKSLDLRDLVLMGFAVGGRIGEVCALRWCDVSIERDGDRLNAEVSLNASVSREKGVGIVRHMPKTESSQRVVPVPRRIAALLLRRARAANIADFATSQLPVFPNPGRWQTGQGSARPCSPAGAPRRPMCCSRRRQIDSAHGGVYLRRRTAIGHSNRAHPQQERGPAGDPRMPRRASSSL